MIFRLYIFLLGTIAGSFITTISSRIPKGTSLKTKSFCPHCGHLLKVVEMIPLFGYFYVKRRCKDCNTKLSFWYPITELFFGLIYTLLFLYNGVSYRSISVALLIVLIIISGSVNQKQVKEATIFAIIGFLVSISYLIYSYYNTPMITMFFIRDIILSVSISLVLYFTLKILFVKVGVSFRGRFIIYVSITLGYFSGVPFLIGAIVTSLILWSIYNFGFKKGKDFNSLELIMAITFAITPVVSSMYTYWYYIGTLRLFY